MELLVKGGYSGTRHRYLWGEDENAHNRILWVTRGEYGHGTGDAIHGNQRDKDEDGGGCHCGSTRAGRANAKGIQ